MSEKQQRAGAPIANGEEEGAVNNERSYDQGARDSDPHGRCRRGFGSPFGYVDKGLVQHIADGQVMASANAGEIRLASPD